MKLLALILMLAILSTLVFAQEQFSLTLDAPAFAAPGSEVHAAVRMLDSKQKAVEGQVTIALLDSRGNAVQTISHLLGSDVVIIAPKQEGTYTLRASFAGISQESVLHVVSAHNEVTGFAVLDAGSVATQGLFAVALSVVVAIAVFLYVRKR